MRKYRQFILLVLTVVSFTGFIVYRKEYETLRSNFDDFGIVFGFEKNPKCMVLNETVNLNNVDFSYPLPGWVGMYGNFYVYSAFWMGRGVSKAVGVGPKGAVPKFKCHIWHDHRDSLFSNRGNFFFKERLVENSSYSLFELSCDIENKAVKGQPYMIIFSTVQGKHFVPVYEGRKKSGVHSNVTVCVYPDFTAISKVSIIEFISYHQVVGVTDFIIYDALHYGLLSKVKKIVVELGLAQVDLLPWHFPFGPFDPVGKAALESDCYHRASDKTSTIAYLNLEEYIVPKLHKSLEFLIESPHSAIINLKMQTCCVDYKSEKRSEKSWPVVLKKTYCVEESSGSRGILVYPQSSGPPSLTSNSSQGVINSYAVCSNPTKFKLIYDPAALKFVGDLLSSKIILLWNSGLFFSQ